MLHSYFELNLQRIATPADAFVHRRIPCVAILLLRKCAELALAHAKFEDIKKTKKQKLLEIYSEQAR